MNMSMKNPLPRPTETEKCFRRFESLIGRMLDQPKPIEVSTSPLTPNTFCVRFRDAVRGFLTHKYPSHLNPDEVREVWLRHQVVVKSDTTAEICARGGAKALKSLGLVNDTAKPTMGNTFVFKDLASLMAFSTLCRSLATQPINHIELQGDINKLQEFINLKLPEEASINWHDETHVTVIL